MTTGPFADFLDRVQDLLRPHGYRRKGAQFGHRRGDDWALVHVQRRHLILLTFNLAISSGAVREFLGEPPSGMPGDLRGHWRYRIGDLMPQKQDTWWPIVKPDGSLNMEPLDALEAYGLPVLERLFEPARLAEEMAERSDWYSVGSRDGLLYATAVARAHGLEQFGSYYERLAALPTRDPGFIALRDKLRLGTTGSA